MNISKILGDVLSNVNLWAAICSTIFIISLGYILLKTKVFKVEWKGVLNSIVLKVGLPALAITGFMKECTVKQLQEQGIILGVAFGFYILLIIIAELWVRFFPKLLPQKLGKSNNEFSYKYVYSASKGLQTKATGSSSTSNQDTRRALVMWMMLIFGSTTFFGMPIIKELYNKNGGLLAANLWNIPYRVFLYSYCFMAISGIKFTKENFGKSLKTAFLNPIVIATFIGLICWLSQLIPGASSFNENFGDKIAYDKNKMPLTFGWFQWDKTMPYFYKPINTIGSLSSPLVWLSIGITLATSSIALAAKDKWVWIFSGQKLILIPLLVFLVMLALVYSGNISKDVAISMVIMAATPPATVAVAYSMQYKVCDQFAAQCSALTTLLAVVMIPLWIVIGEVAFQVI